MPLLYTVSIRYLMCLFCNVITLSQIFFIYPENHVNRLENAAMHICQTNKQRIAVSPFLVNRGKLFHSILLQLEIGIKSFIHSGRLASRDFST